MDKSKFINLALAFGKVVYKPLPNRARVQVALNRLNEILLVYIRETHTLDVHDQSGKSRPGDLVLLKKFNDPEFKFETHTIKEIVFPVGAVVDPITGLRVHRDEYLYDAKPLDEDTLHELSQSAKDYEFTPRHLYEIKEKDLSRKEFLGESQKNLKKG
uniref:28S ribosomal protein S17, mitochondrial-like n=1 Tax=Phallusia mammillata TaxID=59560 RepID=A0A6F9DLY4_9ASCI|nr:28S ribosomal protein S17, mitochondrial-like [Phallusia mammillata]